MKLVLLSGGSGIRLWPLSKDANSKQFLRLLVDDEGKDQSMLQRFFKQVSKAHLLNDTYICTIEEQTAVLNEQISCINDKIIVEPKSRDTFAAIALSACYLKDKVGADDDEVITFSPVDIYVDNSFFETIKIASKAAEDDLFELVMIGIKPTYPAEKYGYIIPKPDTIDDMGFEISSFVEKPSRNVALTLINQGALWNSGFFAFKLKFILNHLDSVGLPTNYNDFLNQYDHIPKKSFDYEIAEKVKTARVISYHDNWSDMGTWDTLTEIFPNNLSGEGCIDQNCSNVHVINQLNIPVNVSGLSNLVVVASTHGILISDKNKSNSIKDKVTQILTQTNVNGKHKNCSLISDDCSNTIIVNKVGLPVLAVGVSQTDIKCNSNGIIITAK